MFHGSGQTGDKHRAFTGGVFDALAARGARGALVAYLDGYRGNWNDALLDGVVVGDDAAVAEADPLGEAVDASTLSVAAVTRRRSGASER